MASLSSLIFLLATLLTQGSCLTCVTCRGPGTDCTGVRRTCGETEDTCLTFVGINSLSGSEKTIETIKVCSDSRSCRAGPVSVTINSEIHFRSISSCCQETYATTKIPPENTTLNGLTCPACFNLASDQCNTVGTLKCVGEDNHCITTSGTIATGDIPVKLVSRGCSSASACALPLDTDIYSAGITFLLKKIECTQP